MKYAFIGGTKRGQCLLQALLENNHTPVRAVVLKEDDHEDARWSQSMTDVLQRNRIPCEVSKRISQATYDALRGDELDFIVVCGWRTLIDPSLTDHLKFGMVAAHDSLLPAYRGFAPLNWAMINGEKKSGVSLFLIRDGDVDSGPIIDQREVEIEPADYAIDVYQKIVTATELLYADFFREYAQGDITLTPQDETQASYTCARSPADGQIDWSQPACDVLCLIRALAPPYPCAYCNLKGEEYRVTKARLGPMNHKTFIGRIPGRVVAIYPEGVEVLCGDGTLLLEEWRCSASKVEGLPQSQIKSIRQTLN